MSLKKNLGVTYLNARPSKVDQVLPFCLQSSVLLRLGVDKLLHVGGVHVARHSRHR